MDLLKEVWGESDINKKERTFSESNNPAPNLHGDSKGTIEKLAKKVFHKLIFAIVLSVALAGFLPFAFPIASQVLLGILLVAYISGSVMLYREYQTLKKGVDMSQDLLHGLRNYRARIKKVVRYEELIGLCMYPISVSGGFILGMQLADENAEVMDSASDWMILIIITLILSFLGDQITKWLNRNAFGTLVARLEKNIEELENGI